MINKELLSEVLGYEVLRYDGIHHDYIEDDVEYTLYPLNIYELAHKCKEWAKGKGFQILSGVDNANTYRADVYYTDLLISDFETIKNTETEAIFKACEWILASEE